MSDGSPTHGIASFAEGWTHGVIRRPATGHHHGAAALPHAATVRTPLLVVKVGGSLLTRRGWPALIGSLVRACDVGPCCLVVGGGAVVDGLRAIDRAHPQPQATMHDLAIDAMRLTARLVSDAVGLPLESAPPDARTVAVLDVPAWLASGVRASSLPIGWQVTSDAIAAHVAVEHGGSLLLAKSVPPPPCPASSEELSELARVGWVDEHFPVTAGSLTTIEWVTPADGTHA